jgi:outer membrane protein W
VTAFKASVTSIGLAVLICSTGSALAYTPGSTLRVFLDYAEPFGSARIEDQKVQADNAVGGGLVFEIRQEHYFGVEVGFLVTEFDFMVEQTEEVVARAMVVPFTIGVDFHLLRRNVEPDLYITPLVSYNLWGDLESAETDEEIDLDNEWGWGAVLGLDIPIGERGWQINLALRYLRMSASVGPNAIDVDPVFGEIGFGYRF